jgi:hypothetical protein
LQYAHQLGYFADKPRQRELDDGVKQLKKVIREEYARSLGWAPVVLRITDA